MAGREQELEDEVLGNAYDGRLMRRLLGYLRPYTRQAALSLVMLVALTLLELAGPEIVKQAIDDAIASARLERLAGYAALYLGAAVCIFVLRYWQNLFLNIAGQRAMHDLRVEIYAHVQGLSLAYFDHTPVGRLMTRLTNDVDALDELLTSGALALLSDAVTLIGIAAALLLLNWKLALITFVVVPPLLLVTQYIRDGMRRSFRAVRTRVARVNGLVAEDVSGMHVIQLFNRQRRAQAVFDEANDDLLQANLGSVLYYALFWPAVGIASGIVTGTIIWYGGGQVIQGALTLGATVAFLQYVDRFFQPIRDVSEKYNILQQAMAAAERIFLVLDQQPEIVDPPEPRGLGRVRGDVEFCHVWFAYEPENWVLRDVSFHIRPGEKVAIVGATGAGKTSIISLLSRFYDIQRGQILVDGKDVREVRQSELRRQIGVVLQDPFLFAGSVARNIRLNETSITDEQVRQAARYVHADEFIQRLPEGYDTVLRERGAGLSVGQKQLLAFARAVAFNPALLLILDEATASVDTETEWLIQQALARLMENRTSVIIAHRLSTIREVDRIIVLQKGEILEEGSHSVLLDQGGIYARLHSSQWRDLEGEDPETLSSRRA